MRPNLNKTPYLVAHALLRAASRLLSTPGLRCVRPPNTEIFTRAAALLILTAALAPAQPQTLTLQQAEAIAIKNHPQIQAAQNELNFAQQQVTINRAPYYPNISGEITGSQANANARI